MTVIDLAAIRPADVVTVADTHGNRAQGLVIIGTRGELQVAAFGTAITFATPNRNDTLHLLGGLRLHDHQPQLFGSDDVIHHHQAQGLR